MFILWSFSFCSFLSTHFDDADELYYILLILPPPPPLSLSNLSFCLFCELRWFSPVQFPTTFHTPLSVSLQTICSHEIRKMAARNMYSLSIIFFYQLYKNLHSAKDSDNVPPNFIESNHVYVNYLFYPLHTQHLITSRLCLKQEKKMFI